jgi:DNA repair protein RadC
MTWSEGMAPREKLLKYGAGHLTDEELLVIFLRTGYPGTHVTVLARQLMAEFGSLHALMTADYSRLAGCDGIGEAKYAQISAVSELARRSVIRHLACGDALRSPEVVMRYIQGVLSRREREIFLVLFLDNQHRLIRHEEMFAGTIDCVEIHPREIVREAMKANAAALILAHNHPSGKAEPSQADRIITEQVIKACQLLDIRVLDHLVIGNGESVSFAARGWI